MTTPLALLAAPAGLAGLAPERPSARPAVSSFAGPERPEGQVLLPASRKQDLTLAYVPGY